MEKDYESLLLKAIDIAINAHKGQVDKAGKQYIFHPLKVGIMGKSYDEKIVGVLHDTVEDTYVTLDYLMQQGFPKEIVDAVDSVTRKNGESYKEFILRAKKNSIARQVKKHDLIDNLNINRIDNPTDEDYKRVEKYNKALRLLEN